MVCRKRPHYFIGQPLHLCLSESGKGNRGGVSGDGGGGVGRLVGAWLGDHVRRALVQIGLEFRKRLVWLGVHLCVGVSEWANRL